MGDSNQGRQEGPVVQLVFAVQPPPAELLSPAGSVERKTWCPNHTHGMTHPTSFTEFAHWNKLPWGSDWDTIPGGVWKMWQLRTWFSGEIVRVMFMVGWDDLRSLFHPQLFSDSNLNFSCCSMRRLPFPAHLCEECIWPLSNPWQAAEDSNHIPLPCLSSSWLRPGLSSCGRLGCSSRSTPRPVLPASPWSKVRSSGSDG